MKTILITGVTGKQGGAVARHLAGKGFHLRGMTRKPDSDAARASGVEIVKGDLDDEASLKAALAGAWGVFAVQNSWEGGVEKEEQQGKRIARLAKAAGVEHFVYTSVGSAHLETGIPHFDNKFRIEQTVKEQKFPAHVILRPVFFMENLLAPWFLQGDKLITAMKPETKLQMIASDDIGIVGAAAFTDPSMKGVEIDIAGDTHTMPEAAALMGEAQRKSITYQPIPNEAVRQGNPDMADMLAWFDAVGYSADIPAVTKRFGHFKTLAEFLRG